MLFVGVLVGNIVPVILILCVIVGVMVGVEEFDGLHAIQISCPLLRVTVGVAFGVLSGMACPGSNDLILLSASNILFTITNDKSLSCFFADTNGVTGGKMIFIFVNTFTLDKDINGRTPFFETLGLGNGVDVGSHIAFMFHSVSSFLQPEQPPSTSIETSSPSTTLNE